MWLILGLSTEEDVARLAIMKDTIYDRISDKMMSAHCVSRLGEFQGSKIDEWVCGGEAAPNAEKKGSDS